MRYIVSLLLVLSLSLFVHAGSPPVYEATELQISSIFSQMQFAGPDISGELQLFGELSGSPFFGVGFFIVAPGRTVVFDFVQSGLFFEQLNEHTRMGPAPAVVSLFGSAPSNVGYYFPNNCGNGPSFPSPAQATFFSNPWPATGTIINVSAPVTFCGTIPIWNSFTPGSDWFRSPPDFLVSFNNLKGTATAAFRSEGVQDGIREGGFVNIRYVASVPPVVTVSAPSTLWPPNGKMVPVTVSGTINTAPNVGVDSAAFSVIDEYGQVQPSGIITVASDGGYSFTTPLQAYRSGGDKNGRQYTIGVIVQDKFGNTGSASTVVTVPHDQGH